MFEHLTVRDFGIIEELHLDLEPGFTAITGETGAGKSMLVSAMALLLGARADTSAIRTGSERATIEGAFRVPEAKVAHLERLGLDTSEPLVVVRRILHSSGRHRAFVNGSPVTASTLREVTAGLMDISSQHEHQSLTRPETALDALDVFSGHGGLARRVQSAYEALSRARGELAALVDAATNREARLDYLRFQVQEIIDFAPREGEDQALVARRDRLRNAVRLVEAAARCVSMLYEAEGSAVELLARAEAEVASMAEVDQELAGLVTSLLEARLAVEDVALRLRDYGSELDTDPASLDEVEARLVGLQRLLRKHGPTVEDLLASLRSMQEEIATLESSDDRAEELRREVARLRDEYLALARDLSRSRREAAGRFTREVERILARLGMPRATLAFEFEGLDEPGPRGLERVELLFGPNPGEAPRPLRKIASGGELSRAMLAMKRVLASVDPVPTYLYDEVDTGVGGPVAAAIGDLLREAGESRQVLCITHNPQVAARAHHHVTVLKETVGDRTVSKIVPLGHQERVMELARMLGGASPTMATIEHAKELLRP